MRHCCRLTHDFKIELRQQASDRARLLLTRALCAAVWIFVAGISVLTPADADDIEVYTANIAAASKPNILFVLDYSGSMSSPMGASTRIDVLRDAVAEIVDGNLNTINAGFSVFATTGGGVKWPIADLNQDAAVVNPAIPAGTLTNADVIKLLVNQMSPGGSTATVPALTEAANFFRGDPVGLGGVDQRDTSLFTPDGFDPVGDGFGGPAFRINSRFAPSPATYTPSNSYEVGNASDAYCRDFSAVSGPNFCSAHTTSDCVTVSETPEVAAHESCRYDYPDKWWGALYNSPIQDSCQQNFIILVSDGQPTNSWANESLNNLIGQTPAQCEDVSTSIFGQPADSLPEGNCGPELTSFLYNNDQIAAIAGSNVTTYSIGFSASAEAQSFLERIAVDGGGEYYEASDSSSLSNALFDILDDIISGSENFTELTLDINRASFSHDNRAFLPMFNPSLSDAWTGNVKGYFLENAGLIDSLGQPATVTDEAGTRFVATARSFWSSSPDGNDIEMGGVREVMATQTRTLYTFTGNSIGASGVSLADPSGVHLLHKDNGAITEAMMNLTPDPLQQRRNFLLDWIQTAPMGDSLHSRLVTVRYPDRQVAFVSTNQGFLHAFDTTTPTAINDHSGGEEVFAFMPQELLPNLHHIKKNRSTGQHIYGLDGAVTRWHDDYNNDGIVNGADTVMLVFGMRRGGSSYYALDVTDINDPVLKWKITAGVTPGFDNLAQSWSRMSLVRVRRDGTPEGAVTDADTDRVLAFAGGYDAAVVDGQTTRLPAAGGGIYIVDRDGDLIWSHTTGMTYSMPADLRIVDSDADTLADRIYAVDLGGQVWRVDFDDINQTADFAVNRIADFGGSYYQPFFYPPAVALSENPVEPYIAVSIGSGSRDFPTDGLSQNRIYTLRDTDIAKGPPATVTLVTETDLYDVTDYELGSADVATRQAAEAALRAARGWLLRLTTGEKVLAPVRVVEGRLLATTFMPTAPTPTSDGCFVIASQSRYYAMDVRNGSPVSNLHSEEGDSPDDELTFMDRFRDLGSGGVRSEPQVFFPPGGEDAQIVVDKQVVDYLPNTVYRKHWFQRDLLPGFSVNNGE